MEEIMIDPWCLTLPKELADERDFKAEQAIQLDYSIKLPSSFSLGERIYKTSNQWSIGSCTAMGTTHGVQIRNVKKNGVKPTTKNIITPDRKDLWSKMWHNPEKYDGWDYVEKAVSTALKQWIKTVEWWEAKFDAYATEEWNSDDKSIETIKRYLYNWNPIVWCIKWDQNMWREMSAWEVKTIPTNTTGWHAIACVGWDEWWFRFINSWTPNDKDKRKSRFYISNTILKGLRWKLNYRYRVLYIKEDAKIDPERLKKINVYTVILEAMKKYYNSEKPEVQQWIIAFSQSVRKEYPEINEKLPLN